MKRWVKCDVMGICSRVLVSLKKKRNSGTCCSIRETCGHNVKQISQPQTHKKNTVFFSLYNEPQIVSSKTEKIEWELPRARRRA